MIRANPLVAGSGLRQGICGADDHHARSGSRSRVFAHRFQHVATGHKLLLGIFWVTHCDKAPLFLWLVFPAITPPRRVRCAARGLCGGIFGGKRNNRGPGQGGRVFSNSPQHLAPCNLICLRCVLLLRHDRLQFSTGRALRVVQTPASKHFFMTFLRSSRFRSSKASTISAQGFPAASRVRRRARVARVSSGLLITTFDLVLRENIIAAIGLHHSNATVSQGHPASVAARSLGWAVFRRRLLQDGAVRVMFWTNAITGPRHAGTLIHGRITR